jgi:Kdo2-lipid IVA lauroyltransferase/acyltransferase
MPCRLIINVSLPMYSIVFGILYGLSGLPLFILYRLSYFLYLLTWWLLGYRKKTVLKNLALAFPGKTPAERKKIAKAFYRHFWDNWMEALKLLRISPEDLRKRISGNLDILDKIHAEGSSCYILPGHQFNWEWANAFVSLRGPFDILAAYAPLSNKIVDRLFLHLRRRFGTVLLPFNDMRRGMLPYRHRQHALALMADQSPPGLEKSYWPRFFNTPTAFLKGPEAGARLGKLPVVFISINRPRRGYYHLEASLLTANAGLLPPGELTKLYAQQLEASVRANPAGYLWSHNRWKLEQAVLKP